MTLVRVLVSDNFPIRIEPTRLLRHLSNNWNLASAEMALKRLFDLHAATQGIACSGGTLNLAAPCLKLLPILEKVKAFGHFKQGLIVRKL